MPPLLYAFSSRSFSGLDNVIFQTIGMVIGGRHPGFYFLDETETSDLVGTITKQHYYIVGWADFFYISSTFANLGWDIDTPQVCIRKKGSKGISTQSVWIVQIITHTIEIFLTYLTEAKKSDWAYEK